MPIEAREDVRSPETRVKYGCGPQWVFNPTQGSLQEHHILLTTKPSPQFLNSSFYENKKWIS